MADIITISSEQMEDYLRFFNDDKFVKETDEKRLALARKCIDILLREDNELALRTKGYACYGGNRLYPCDWIASRDCINRLFEKTDNPQFANTLGYIYYYGRCNGGVPEYDKAFYYFGIAAANGLYEGMYKLADMFAHGYGCKESKNTARSLYSLVYDDSIKNFLKGSHANFADAALRMGNVFAKGIGEAISSTTAYYYYLQADYAAKLRMRDNDFFGYATVALNTEKALAETEAKLPGGFFTDHLEHIYPAKFSELAENNNRCLLTRKVTDLNNVELTAERIPTRSVPEPEAILVTIPYLKICERTLKVSYILDSAAEIWFRDDSEQVRYDFCDANDDEQQFEFYYDDELVAWIKSDWYSIYREPEKEASGPEYRLVSIHFGANGREYDYICEDENVQPGDTAIVEGYDGETEVEVVKVTIKRESELGLPVERYKKIMKVIK